MKRTATSLVLTFILMLTMSAQVWAIQENDSSDCAPSGIVLAKDGGYLVTDIFNKVIWKVAADGTAIRAAGQISISDVNGEPIGILADGTILTAFFQNPWDIAPFLNGYLVSEPDAHVIRYVSDTSVQTAAGSGKAGFLNHFGVKAEFSRPTGLAAGGSGEVYIADTDNGAIRCLAVDGHVSTVCTGLSEPTGLFWHDGALYVAETGGHCISVIRQGVRTVLTGFNGAEGYTNGLASAARFRSPMGVAVGGDGTVYIADTGNGAVRQLRDGVVSTLKRSSDTSAPVRPRSVLPSGSTLLITDPFVKNVFTISLEREKFTDVESDSWYENAVYAAVERGLFVGIGNRQFAPNATTDRAMLAAMISGLQRQLDGDVIITGNAALTDVEEDAWYSDVSRWTVELGIIDAENGVFDPDAPITREEMVTALWKFAKVQGTDTSSVGNELARYQDADSISAGARDAMSWAIAKGIIAGVSENELSPQGTTTRAQMAQVMIRFMDLQQK